MATRRKGVRWGRVHEIAGISRVPTSLKTQRKRKFPAFDQAPRRLQKLSAWRRMHEIASHQKVRNFCRKIGYKPSSNIPLRSMVEFIRNNS